MVLAFEPAFIQSPEHRSKPADIDAGGIPLIDLAPFHLLDQEPPPPEVEALVAQVGAACREWGFFQAINHGVLPGVMERAWAASKGFYALPPEERRRVRRDEVNPLGYYEAENTKNVRDWKEVFDFVVYDPAVIPIPSEGGVKLIELHNQWPQSPSGFKEAMTEYAKAAEELAFKLLELIALSLNLPAKRLHDFFTDQTSFVRLNHYPPCPSPDLALGVGRHKDGGAITILAQDEVGGLDVKRLSDGEWVRVKPIPNSFIINVGDLVQSSTLLPLCADLLTPPLGTRHPASRRPDPGRAALGTRHSAPCIPASRRPDPGRAALGRRQSQRLGILHPGVRRPGVPTPDPGRARRQAASGRHPA